VHPADLHRKRKGKPIEPPPHVEIAGGDRRADVRGRGVRGGGERVVVDVEDVDRLMVVIKDFKVADVAVTDKPSLMSRRQAFELERLSADWIFQVPSSSR
jgi:hypothetical protein